MNSLCPVACDNNICTLFNQVTAVGILWAGASALLRSSEALLRLLASLNHVGLCFY